MMVGVVDVDIHAWSHLKEELAWAVGKQLHVISTVKSTKELKGTSRFKFKTILYTLLYDLQ